MEGAGAILMYPLPYSSELSPIENCWSKLKTKLRSAKARTRQALDEALAAAIDSISDADAQGWFKHCDYLLHRHEIRSNVSTCSELNAPSKQLTDICQLLNPHRLDLLRK
ncbi:transposase [Noviherbaspirillum sp. Root189]|uniref:transposase n=1 Tax=Noviherbaspirillum sp. Root189 TaxID=1736487 RepID=UPI003FA54D5A